MSEHRPQCWPPHISSSVTMCLFILLSSVFVLACVSAAIPVEREFNMVVAQFVDTNFIADVEVRAYGEGLKLYARGGGMSKLLPGHNKGNKPPSYRKTMKEPPPYQRSPPSLTHLIPYQTNRSVPPPTYRNAWKDPVVMTQLDGRPPRLHRTAGDVFRSLSRGASHTPLVGRSEFGHAEGA